MRVLFISRATLFSGNGGDTVQIKNTAAYLRNLGVEVTIELCNNKHIDYSQYDLVHYFNIIRPSDIIYHIDKSKLPFVVSSIYLEFKDQVQGDKQGLKDRILGMLDKNTQEYLKCIARAVVNGERITSFKYLWLGHKRSIRYILKRCLYLLPNSHSEYRRLKHDFPMAGQFAVVPNAMDTHIYHIDDRQIAVKKENSLLCIARFEPRKNQLNIIRALNGTPYQLTFAGNVAPNHKHYYEECRKEAGSNMTFLDFVSQDKVLELYRSHKVHILASWFETTGLSSLEAIACGCNIVISKKGDTEEYFGEHAFYCDPGSMDSIREAVDKAMKAPVNREFMNRVSVTYNWEVAARKTFDVYQKVMGA
jgi:glycosyltransferase involved in cell wall biosynthesis